MIGAVTEVNVSVERAGVYRAHTIIVRVSDYNVIYDEQTLHPQQTYDNVIRQCRIIANKWRKENGYRRATDDEYTDYVEYMAELED